MSHPAVRVTSSNRRSFPEQIVGLGIITLCSFFFAVLSILFFGQESEWYTALHRPAWSIGSSWSSIFFSSVHAILALSFWIIWRRHSLRTLKLELSIFLAGFFLEALWSASLYRIHQLLPSLIALLLWMCGAIVLSALFWKKDKLSGKILLFPLLWILYLISINMMLCIANNYP